MIEFTISFRYAQKDQRAGVMKSMEDKMCKYAVRPIDPDIVKKFGKQIVILKNNDNYEWDSHKNEDHIDLFNALVIALKEQDNIAPE